MTQSYEFKSDNTKTWLEKIQNSQAVDVQIEGVNKGNGPYNVYVHSNYFTFKDDAHFTCLD